MASIVRPIKEQGVVLSKEVKEATNEFKAKDGSVVPAQPKRFVVMVASSYDCNNETGLGKPTILDYKVDEELFNKIKYLSEVEVIYEMSTSGTNKPISLNLIVNK